MGTWRKMKDVPPKPSSPTPRLWSSSRLLSIRWACSGPASRGDRQQQFLDGRVFLLAAEPFVKNPLMGGMLIDDEHLRRSLDDNKPLEDLADDLGRLWRSCDIGALQLAKGLYPPHYGGFESPLGLFSPWARGSWARSVRFPLSQGPLSNKEQAPVHHAVILKPDLTFGRMDIDIDKCRVKLELDHRHGKATRHQERGVATLKGAG